MRVDLVLIGVGGVVGGRFTGWAAGGPPLPLGSIGIGRTSRKQEGGQLAAELRRETRGQLKDPVPGRAGVVLGAEPVDHLGWLAGLDGARQAGVGDGTPDIGDWHEIHLT